MTPITLTIRGNALDLRDIKHACLRFASTTQIRGSELRATYWNETADHDEALERTMDCIDIDLLEALGGDVVTIG